MNKYLEVIQILENNPDMTAVQILGELARKGFSSSQSEVTAIKGNYFQQMLEHHEALANYYRDFLRKGD
jgi:hypothetical protein